MIAAGFGCRKEATTASLEAALAVASAHVARPVTLLATLRDRAPQLLPLAEALGLPLILLDPPALEGQPTLTRSPASLAAHGIGSVAEAAALAAAGPGARLITSRFISPDRLATCALAEGVPS